ncbi:MAG: hypothetical protein QMD14_04780, partial [Candidatus Aenigmarchaeota archaeon]|nr:hypothetical protein [Candidatus Aenigmarchaeota archaeon]
LYFHFVPNANKVYSILHPITFENKKLPPKTTKKVKKYLKKLIKKDKLVFTQGASFICGYKQL